jgi:hypothetical protein
MVTEKQVRSYFLDKLNSTQTKNAAVIDKKFALATAKDLFVLEELQKTLKKIFCKGWATPIKYKSKSKKSCNRIVNNMLSDLHFGVNLKSNEVPHEYGPIQESRRLGAVAQQVVEYKTQYRNESKLIIHLLGDIIQGILHDPREGEPFAYQTTSAIHYLTQYIMFCCSEYPQVEIYCTPGNHGRNPHRHPQRAIHQKWDAIETVIYNAVKMAVLNSGIKNCQFFIPKTPYYIAPLFNNKGFFTHGDTVLTPGPTWKTISVGSLANQTMKWNTARNVGGPFQLFGCGHVHVGSVTHLPGNVIMIINSCLVPSDEFAVSIGKPDTTCGQYLFESTEKFACGDHRFISVDDADDKQEYNSIIEPFPGL